jgi:dTDP-4-dehydrorhamnose 3,5-epimerase
MNIISLEIPDVKVIQPDVFEDDRGYFYESYNKLNLGRQGIPADFVQDNQSCSVKGVLRGLHFQNPPYEQGKLVRVVQGAVQDVAVDLRKESPFYGQWVSRILSGENKLMMWLPPGFAHGFLTLEDETIFAYKCTNYYSRESECVILWNDPSLAIDWDVSSPIISDRDSKGILFTDFISLF